MKNKFILLALFISLVPITSAYLSPMQVRADNGVLDYSGFVQCDGVVGKGEAEAKRKVPCNFATLVLMVKYLINWMFMITIPIFTGILAYGGLLFMTPNPSNKTKAKNMLWAAVVGFVIMLSAWLLVSTILKLLVDDKFIGEDSFLEVNK